MEKVQQLKRGRPAILDHEALNDLLERHIGDIFDFDDNRVISRTSEIWTTLAKELGNGVLPTTIYTYACRFKKNFQNDEDKENEIPVPEIISSDGNMSDVSDSCFLFEEDLSLEIKFRRNDFMNLTERYNKTCKGRKGGVRPAVKLKPGEYADLIGEKIFRKTSLPCAFQMKHAHISNSYDSGSIQGYCKCGSTLKINIDFTSDPENVILVCKIRIGQQDGCGQRWLRNPKREAVAEILKSTTVEKYRADLANQLMVQGEHKAPTLHSGNVLRNVRHEAVAKNYLDPDPMKAIDILSHSQYANEIHLVSRKPFMVHYWTSAEMQLYKKYGNEKDSYVSIDATGDIVHPLQKLYNMPAGPVFLYEIVLRCSKGQLTVGHMLSECHDTDKIQFFLQTHLRMSGVIPKEVVTDMSRSLINAVARTYTGFRYVEEYADACDTSDMSDTSKFPKVYIRLDNNHFIHLYAGLFKNHMRGVKKFFMGAMGQLIMCRSKKKAGSLIKKIFTLALSKTYGKMADGQPSPAQKSKESLESLITENTSDEILNDSDDEAEESEIMSQSSQLGPGCEKLAKSTEKITENNWYRWGLKIQDKVRTKIKDQKGSELNPYYMPGLVKYLSKHLALLPLWSNVCRDEFNYGKVPATSCSESENKRLKHDVFPDLPHRVDYFLQKHFEFLKGRMKLVEAPSTNMLLESVKEKQNSQPLIESVSARVRKPQIQTIETIVPAQNNCPACRNGEPYPRKCEKCFTGIHHLDGCSYAMNGDEDEGYNQKRLCQHCYSQHQILKPAGTSTRKRKAKDPEAATKYIDLASDGTTSNTTDDYKPLQKRTKEGFDTSHEISFDVSRASEGETLSTSSQNVIGAVREIENWRGQAKSQNNALYYGGRKELLKDAIRLESKHKIQVIKNGNHFQSTTFNFKNKTICVENTCAFDSFAQLLYVAISDHNALREKIALRGDSFCKFLMKVYEKGVNAHSYKLRAEMLVKLQTLVPVEGSSTSFSVDASSNALDLASKLTEQFSTIVETLTCSKNCLKDLIERKKKSTQVLDNQIKDLSDMRNLFSLQGLCETCNGNRTNMKTELGEIVIIEVMNESPTRMSDQIKLKNIPRKLQNPTKDNRDLRLLGLISYKGPQEITSLSQGIVHYTAVCLRNETWYEFDNGNGKVKTVTKSQKVVPEALIYTTV